MKTRGKYGPGYTVQVSCMGYNHPANSFERVANYTYWISWGFISWKVIFWCKVWHLVIVKGQNGSIKIVLVGSMWNEPFQQVDQLIIGNKFLDQPNKMRCLPVHVIWSCNQRGWAWLYLWISVLETPKINPCFIPSYKLVKACFLCRFNKISHVILCLYTCLSINSSGSHLPIFWIFSVTLTWLEIDCFLTCSRSASYFCACE